MSNINKKQRLETDETNLLLETLKNVERNYHKKIFYTEDYFKILPDELILHIFRFLPHCEALLSSCSQVCKRWKRLSTDISLWRNVNLTKKKIPMNELRKLINFGIHRLKLTNCTIKENQKQLLKNEISNSVEFYDLRYINLYNVIMSIDSLINLLSYCCNLTEINISWQKINDEVCECIARNTNLITLDLFACFGNLTASGIIEIFRRCTNIQTFNFAILDFSEEHLNSVFDTFIECPNIKFMCLYNRNMLDKHIQKITEYCPNLIKLDLTCCTNLTPSSITFIVDGLPKLQYLSISCNDFILPETLLELRRLRNLIDLKVLLGFGKPFPKKIKEKLEKALIHVKVYQWP